jgi:aminoglycoside phosphotransferase family enzyme
MRRFASEELFEAVAQRGELCAALLHRLADHIGRFHDDAAIRPGVDGGCAAENGN